MTISEMMQSLITIADLHADRLKKAMEHIAHLVPFQPTTVQNFSDNELSYVDMMTSRFTKLQDILGSKIFPLFLQCLQESKDGESFLDRLHKLEKLGILPSSKEWVAMRELRNHFTHEYPDNPGLMASNLNKAVESAHYLIAFWNKFKDEIFTRLQ